METKHKYDNMQIGTNLVPMAKASTTDKERTSVFLSTDKIWALKYMSLMGNTNQTEIIDKALDDVIKQWVKAHGPIPPPSKK